MQMDIYVFIAKQIDGRFQNKTYFYYKNFKRNRSMVESEFETSIIEYETNTEWVRDALINLKHLLHDGFAPEPILNVNIALCKTNIKYQIFKKDEVIMSNIIKYRKTL